MKFCQNCLEKLAGIVTPRAGVWIEMSSNGHWIYPGTTSLPVRECGLKCLKIPAMMKAEPSLPVRECGLKFLTCIKGTIPNNVTPRAGVWIEMSGIWRLDRSHTVTPRAGVWIEIYKEVCALYEATGHSPCGSVD